MIRNAIILAPLLLLAGCAARTPVSHAAPSVPLPAPPPPHVEPPAYSALSPETLRARLGAPAFSRQDGATEMWRYDAENCHAYFFFTAGKVAHVETIPRGPGDTADAGCLNALKKAS